MSTLSSVNNNKAALFLLKNFSKLNNPFTFNDLQKSLDSLIEPFIVDKSLENTSQIFKKFIEDEEQKKVFLQNNPSADQWRIIVAIYPNFSQASLEDIFRSAIQATPGCSKEDSQQIYTRLIRKPEIDLNQIYTQYYPAEFLTWVQNEIYGLPGNSTLLLLRIWRNFDQPIDQAWKTLLSLPDLSSSHKEKLIAFQSKQNFINKNCKDLQIIRLESIPTSEKQSISRSIRAPRKYLNQYILLTKALNILLSEVATSYLEKSRFCILGFQKGSWEYQLLYTPKEISYKILTWRAKNIFPLYQEKFKLLIEFFDKKIEPLKEAKQKVRELEDILKQIQRGISIYVNSNLKGMREVSEEKAKRDKTNKLISKEQIETYLKNWKETEKSLQSDLAKSITLRDDISHIAYLMEELNDSFQVKKSQQEITQNQIALIEKNQKELIQAEYISFQKEVLSTALEEPDSANEIIEESSSSDRELINIEDLNTPILAKLPLDEIDTFLEEGGLVDGFLSKSIDRTLKQLKTHLFSKTHPYVSGELNVIQKEKVEEIHTQLVIATATIELIIQAIQDQRFDQVLLGFRSSLIHCHFAIEQTFSLKILAESKELTNTHDLIELAKKAHIDRLEEQREFFKDMGIHLWFCYPEDYRFFYPEESSHPKPFIFLQKLAHARNEGKLDIVTLKEAVQLCFRMYSQTLEFITESESFSAEDMDEFLKKMDDVQKQLQIKIESGDFNKAFSENKTPISRKCSQALGLLKSVNKLENIQNFEELLLPINTIKAYLEWMEISLRTSQNSHSLQEFIQVETLANMDKLFKHLFRAIIFLQTGKNDYSHNLSELLKSVEKFYEKSLITEKDKLELKELNISITHHYLHRNSNASLKKDYKDIWDLAYRLNLLSARDCALMYKGHKISYQDLELKVAKIFKRLDTAIELFIKLLKPTITEIEKLSNFS